MDKVGFDIKGELRGVAEVRDKDGNLKGTFTFGGEATLEDVARVSGKSEEYIEQNLGKNLMETPNGSNPDHDRA